MKNVLMIRNNHFTRFLTCSQDTNAIVVITIPTDDKIIIPFILPKIEASLLENKINTIKYKKLKI